MLGYICDAGYISDGGYMGSAPCPQCRDAAAIRGVRTRREDAGYLGSQPQAPNISDGVYLGECPSPEVFMGSAPYLRCQTLPLFGESEPIQRRKLFGEPTPSPQYLRWHVFGRCPSPKVFMGSAPCPQCQTLPLFGVPNPYQRRKLFGEPTPSPQYLRWRVFGRMPKPRGVYGECPIPPMSDAAAIRGVRTHSKTQAIWGANPKPPISPMACIWEKAQAQVCLWGAPHAPQDRRFRFSGECPNPYNSIFHFQSSLYS